MKVNVALKKLDDVLAFKGVIPFVKYTGGIGRKAMAKQCKAPGSKGRWPVKATAVYKDLLENAASNAETKGLDPDTLVIDHAQVNRAPPGRRRTVSNFQTNCLSSYVCDTVLVVLSHHSFAFLFLNNSIEHTVVSVNTQVNLLTLKSSLRKRPRGLKRKRTTNPRS